MHINCLDKLLNLFQCLYKVHYVKIANFFFKSAYMGNLIVRDSKCFNFFTKNRKYKYCAQWGSTWSEIFIFFHAEIAAGISAGSQVVPPSPNKIAPGNWGTPENPQRRFGPRFKGKWRPRAEKEEKRRAIFNSFHVLFLYCINYAA